MTIKQNLVPASKYPLKCPHAMTPIGICVHNTANDASAKNEISYMVTNTTSTSFHLAVDDIEVWQGLPLDRNGWHAGDGATGDGNRKHIGIEICYSKSGGDRFTKAENNAAQLVADLLKERNWYIEKVKKHQDFSGKYCPHRTLDLGWDRFLNLVKTKMKGSTMTDYRGYDLDNKESMKVAVDSHIRIVNGEVIPKTELDKALLEQANRMNQERDRATEDSYARGKADGLAAGGALPFPLDQVDFTKYEDNGVNVSTTRGDQVFTVNFRKNEE